MTIGSVDIPTSIIGFILVIIGAVWLSFIFRTYIFPKKLSQIARMVETGNTKTAIRLLKSFIAKNERNMLAHWLLGEAYYKEKKYQLAIVEYKQALKIGEFTKEITEARIRKRLAQIYRYYNQLDEAQKELILVSNLEPDNYEVLYEIGELFYLRNLIDNAVAYFTKALRINPQHPDSHYYLGVIYYNAGKFEEAQIALNKAIQYNPRHYKAHLYLGLVYKNLGQFDSASREFELAQRDPEIKLRALLENGKTFFERGNITKATVELERALKFAKEEDDITIEIRYWLAACYEKARDLPSAIEQWEKIAEHRPSYKDVPEKLAVYAELRTDDRLKDFLTASATNFQLLCQKLANAMGYDVSEVIPIDDDGVDLLVAESELKWRGAKRTNIYMKIRRITKPVGELALRELYEELRKRGAIKGVYVTTSTFAPSAVEFASTRPIDLVDKKLLTEYLKKIT